jgi:hypothetical protein
MRHPPSPVEQILDRRPASGVRDAEAAARPKQEILISSSQRVVAEHERPASGHPH